MNKSKYELVLCIVNAGFSEAVMDAAKEVGARGGTVIHARGTANREAEQFFNITIQPDKELVMILVPSEIKDNVLHALYQGVGLKTAGQGIAFSLPVDDVVGLTSTTPSQEKKADKKSSPASADTPTHNKTSDNSTTTNGDIENTNNDNK